MSVTQDAPGTDTETVTRPVTLRAAARRLGLNSWFVKGVAVGIGIRLDAVGCALVMSEDDFHRLRSHLSGQRLARRFVGTN